MKTNELRQLFLNYFREQNHTIVPSSSLVPGNDPTLLFTNAGMVQFKDVFLGLDKRPYTRATSSQRCVRAGGKHNDLENVGYTARHHTFFEMLGNFSFGDYFKREAIQYAWGLLTQVLKLPIEKLWITIYQDDEEARAIWLNEMGVAADRIIRCGEKSNFWAMGDTGPCGPCTEIFYDHGAHIAGGPPGSPDEDGDRYVEIWNLVFMQYNRDANGALTPLPKPAVDTGMGLERIAAVMQGVNSNYDIDLFQALIKQAAELTHVSDLKQPSLRVIADHIRSTSFLIIDGVLPSNEGRGYVLRRIIRRALRHGHALGQKHAFFSKLVPALVNAMGDAYPELKKMQTQIEKVLLQEEEQFARTLESGLKILSEGIAQLSGKTIPGHLLFKLYDTYGFPVDLTADIAREQGLQIDQAGFEKEMERQRDRSKEASQFHYQDAALITFDKATQFIGYESLNNATKILALFKEGKPVDQLSKSEKGIIILEETPFYAEAGGQVGDKGILQIGDNQFHVQNTTKNGEVYLHHGVVAAGKISVNDTAHGRVDESKRRATMRNHSATHLLHAALQRILGEHVAQKGSLVDAERLRFDFAHSAALTSVEIEKIEQLIFAQIIANHAVVTEIQSPEEAIAGGAMALFGEKYGDKVRVLTMGDFSKELCGGTHVTRTGEIGLCKIVQEGAIAAGVRRIEALTGHEAFAQMQQQQKVLTQLSLDLNTKVTELPNKLESILQKQKLLEKEIAKMQLGLASQQAEGLLQQAKMVKGLQVIVAEVPTLDGKILRSLVEQIKDKLTEGVVLLASCEGPEKVNLIAGVTANSVKQVNAGQLINQIATKLGGRGGGRADFAQAGCKNTTDLAQELSHVVSYIENMVG